MINLSQHKQALLCADPQSIAAYEQAMNEAVAAVARWLEDRKMYTGGSVSQLRPQVKFTPNAQGEGLQPTLQNLVELFLNKSLKVHHPHSLAHLHCPTMVASQVAEVLINATNQSMDSWDQSPVASLMEVELIRWLREKVGYAKGDAGVFTSGGTQSNLMGLLLARDACIAKHWQQPDGTPWSVQQLGIPAEALQKVKVVCSENAHFSVQKNMAMMGMGFQSVVTVPVNQQAQIDVAQLEQTLQRLQADGKLVACVVATAGTTDAGAIDPIAEIRQICDQFNSWLHIDAAWGGALLLSKQYKHWLAGIEQADSITLDFHKHFFQSISCGAFLLKDSQNFRFIHYEAEYLNSAYDEEYNVPNLVSKSLQTTRRFDALKLWFTIQALGEDLYSSIVEHGVHLSRQVAQYINANQQLELLIEPQFASVLFRVTPKGYPTAFIDNLNQNVADELFARGEANIGVTKINGQQALKMTLLSPVIQLEDVQNLLNQVINEADRIKDSILAGTYTPPIA